MKNLIKFGVAGALALGASMAAQAQAVGPTSTSTGDVFLFADVYNGNTLVDAYAGDTGISVSSIGGGTLPSAFSTTALSGLLSEVTGSDSIIWALSGGNDSSGTPYIIVSQTSTATLPAITGTKMATISGGNNAQIAGVATTLSNAGVLDGTLNDSTFSGGAAGSPVTAFGTGFNPKGTTADVSNQYKVIPNTGTTGLNTAATVYLLTSTSEAGSVFASASKLVTAELTSSGLTFSALGGSGSTVPVPAAVWLLGSGLLGLAGVARRKASV